MKHVGLAPTNATNIGINTIQKQGGNTDENN